jgi:hypothetical protein
MMTKLHLPTLAAHGVMFALPINEAVDRLMQSARELDAASDKIAREREEYARSAARAEDESFAQKLRAAVQRQLPSRSRRKTAAASAADEIFGQKVARIAKEKAKQRRM